MALVTKQKKRIPIPHEEGEWVEIRRLSAKQLEDSQIQRTINAAGIAKAFGGDIYKVTQELRDAAEDDADPIEEAGRDPLNAHDRWTVLRHGVNKWSYSEDKPKPRDLEELDDDTVNYLARAILLYSDHPDIEFGESMEPALVKALSDGKAFQEALDEQLGIVEIEGNVQTLSSNGG